MFNHKYFMSSTMLVLFYRRLLYINSELSFNKCQSSISDSLIYIVINSLVKVYSLEFLFRWCHMASYVWCFGYLAFFRAAHWFGLPRPHPVTNAIQLFNALRVNISYEQSVPYLQLIISYIQNRHRLLIIAW